MYERYEELEKSLQARSSWTLVIFAKTIYLINSIELEILSSSENLYEVRDGSSTTITFFHFIFHTRFTTSIVFTWQYYNISFLCVTYYTFFWDTPFFLGFTILGISSALVGEIGTNFKLILIIQLPFVTLHPWIW